MDVTDTGVRSAEEYAAEEAWLGRMQDHAPGLDPRTNYREHHDPVVTAAPGPIESDGSILGGEKERVLTGRWVDEGMPPLVPVPDAPVEVLPGEGAPLVRESDVADMHTPLGTPEGWVPARGEVVGGGMEVDGVPW